QVDLVLLAVDAEADGLAPTFGNRLAVEIVCELDHGALSHGKGLSSRRQSAQIVFGFPAFVKSARPNGRSDGRNLLRTAAQRLRSVQSCHHVVNEPVRLRLVGGEPSIPVGVRLDLLDGLARLLRRKAGDLLLRQPVLRRLYRDVRGRTADAGRW